MNHLQMLTCLQPSVNGNNKQQIILTALDMVRVTLLL
jgi:hypothetical protein